MNQVGHPANLFNLLNGIKRRNRRGWNLKGLLNINESERVSSHVWSSEDIAFCLLPKNSSEVGFDKLQIIEMLHFHDSAEAFLGDLVRDEKKPEDQKKERKYISMISTFGMVDSFADLTNIKDLYLEFEESKSVNAKYAHDCDKLECVLQAKNYFIRELITEKVCSDFITNLRNELKTDWGKSLFRMFNSLDMDFLSIEEKFIIERKEAIGLA